MMERTLLKMSAQEKKIRLAKTQKLFYSFGHILNDLCANCWFSYILLYMTRIVGLSDSQAGLILLVGQLADAFSTLIVGYCCDKTRFRWYGRRKLWHGVGVVAVAVCFPFIFNLCMNCEHSTATIQIVYYSAFVSIFQFGWASTQIAHLALIPEITHSESEIVELNAIRSGLTFFSGIFVYGVTWLLLRTNSDIMVNKSVSKEFMYLGFIIVGVGLFFSMLFHFGIKEDKVNTRANPSSTIENINTGVNNERDIERISPFQMTTSPAQLTTSPVQLTTSSENNPSQALKQRTWKNWLKKTSFYKTGILYMCTRLSVNIFQSFYPLYLDETLHFPKEAIAYFPLIVLISGSVTSLFLKVIIKKIGPQFTYVLGACFMVATGTWLFLVTLETRESVYGASWLAGTSSSIILVTSLAKTADLIGRDKDSGAFVYSVMSFTDKLSTGVVIFIIQSIRPTKTDGSACENCEMFSKVIQCCIPAGVCIAAIFVVVFLFPSQFECKRKSEYSEDVFTQTDNVAEEVVDEDNEKTREKKEIAFIEFNQHIINERIAGNSIKRTNSMPPL